MASPSSDTGMPCSKPMTISRGLGRGRTVVSDQTPSGGGAHGSSISPHSMARPHRFSSIEYGCSLVAGDRDAVAGGVLDGLLPGHAPAPHRAPPPRGRAPASAVDTSKRTWSLPLPVQPWATASAPKRRAASTRCLTMTGRDSDETSGYLPSYRALARRAGRHEVAGELLAAVDHHRLDRPGGQRPRRARASQSPPWPTSDGHGDHLDAQLLDHPAHGHRRVEAAAVGQDHSLRHGQIVSSLLVGSLRDVGQAGQVGAAARPPRRRRRRSATTTMRVSSPATVPRMSGRPARSRAEADHVGRARAGCAARPGWRRRPPRRPSPRAPAAGGPRGRRCSLGSSGMA